jgi:hypothetical protein
MVSVWRIDAWGGLEGVVKLGVENSEGSKVAKESPKMGGGCFFSRD